MKNLYKYNIGKDPETMDKFRGTKIKYTKETKLEKKTVFCKPAPVSIQAELTLIIVWQ